MTEDQILLAVLILIVQPLPLSFTHVFKFLSMEHSMFKKVIRVNSGNKHFLLENLFIFSFFKNVFCSH